MIGQVEVDPQPTELPFVCRNIVEGLAGEGVGCDWHVQFSMRIRTIAVRGKVPGFSPFRSAESSPGRVESSGSRSGSVDIVTWRGST